MPILVTTCAAPVGSLIMKNRMKATTTQPRTVFSFTVPPWTPAEPLYRHHSLTYGAPATDGYQWLLKVILLAAPGTAPDGSLLNGGDTSLPEAGRFGRTSAGVAQRNRDRLR